MDYHRHGNNDEILSDLRQILRFANLADNSVKKILELVACLCTQKQSYFYGSHLQNCRYLVSFPDECWGKGTNQCGHWSCSQILGFFSSSLLPWSWIWPYDSLWTIKCETKWRVSHLDGSFKSGWRICHTLIFWCWWVRGSVSQDGTSLSLDSWVILRSGPSCQPSLGMHDEQELTCIMLSHWDFRAVSFHAISQPIQIDASSGTK